MASTGSRVRRGTAPRIEGDRGVFCSGDYSVCECVSLKVDEDEERGDRNCDRKWVMPCLYESSVSVD